MSLDTQWTPVCPVADLAVGRPKVFKSGPRQIAVFHLADGEIFAIDNRCPHEGYPLAQGTVEGDTLTCCWHNFKFDLRSGACLKGDEAVRVWPVRRVEGMIEVDLAEPDPAAQRPALLESLDGAIFQRKVGQMARDVVRLLQTGDLDEVTREIAAISAIHDCERGEWGNAHGLPVATDALQAARLLAEDGELPALEARALALTQSLEMTALFNLRRPPRPAHPPLPIGDHWGHDLLEAVEAEDTPTAVGLIRGALEAGLGPASVAPWLIQINAAHLLSFGHGLIYVMKALELLDEVGWSHAPRILPGVVEALINGTREDTLPPWKKFRRALEARWAEALAATVAPAEAPVAPVDIEGSREAVAERLLRSAPGEAADVVIDALMEGSPLITIAEGIALGAGRRLARFDPSIHHRADVQDTWLFCTHLLTHAESVVAALPKCWDDEAALRLVCLAARFVAGGQALDGPEVEIPTPSGDLAELLEALDAGDRARAHAAVEMVMAEQGALVIKTALIKRLLTTDRTSAVSIFMAHHLKTIVAACRLARRLESSWPIHGLVHWLVEPGRERVVSQSVKEAIDLVTEGRTPKMLWK